MAKSSNASKQQWNSARYTQIKAYVKPENLQNSERYKQAEERLDK